jgi:hypothetical protein
VSDQQALVPSEDLHPLDGTLMHNEYGRKAISKKITENSIDKHHYRYMMPV